MAVENHPIIPHASMNGISTSVSRNHCPSTIVQPCCRDASLGPNLVTLLYIESPLISNYSSILVVFNISRFYCIRPTSCFPCFTRVDPGQPWITDLSVLWQLFHGLLWSSFFNFLSRTLAWSDSSFFLMPYKRNYFNRDAQNTPVGENCCCSFPKGAVC